MNCKSKVQKWRITRKKERPVGKKMEQMATNWMKGKTE